MIKYNFESVEYLNKWGEHAKKAWRNIAKRVGFKPIEVGDFVKCVDFSKLTDKQMDFLKAQDSFEVTAITDRMGKPWESGLKYVEIGYSIPLMLSRFQRVKGGESTTTKEIDITKFKYKVLFISFDIKLKTYGEEDVEKILRGCDSTVQLFPKIFNEKLPKDVYTKFIGYDDVYRYKNDYYVSDVCLREYDFVFFGFMASATNMASLLVNYAERVNIPHMKYETYDYFHNKAYQFDLLETLGYPYIPSILTTKLTNGILQNVKEFGYPVIVKDVYKDRGEGVWKMNDEKALIRFFKGGYDDDDKKSTGDEVGYTYNYRRWTPANTSLVLIQKFIPNDGEWRVITVKNKIVLIARKDALPNFSKRDIDERRSKKGNLPQEVKNMIEDVSKHLFSDIVGFDIIQDLQDKKYYIIETNASPHFSMFSVVTNVSVPEKIVDYIIGTFKNK